MSLFRTLWTSLVGTLALTAFTSTAIILALMAFISTAMTPYQNNTNGGSVPEIDPSSIGSGLALLGFGAAMLLDHRRRKYGLQDRTPPDQT